MRRRYRKPAVAERESHTVQRQSERIRGHLRHRRVRARTHVTRAALNVGGAVGVDPCQRRALAAGRVIDGRRHADADQLVTIERGARCGVSSRPAEGGGALPEAVGQPTGRKRQIRRDVVIGFVAHPQVDRIHSEAECQVVHGGLQRERPCGGAGPAHRTPRVDIKRHNAIRRPHVRCGVLEAGPRHHVVLVGVVPRGLGMRLVHDGTDAAGAVRAYCHALPAGGR